MQNRSATEAQKGNREIRNVAGRLVRTLAVPSFAGKTSATVYWNATGERGMLTPSGVHSACVQSSSTLVSAESVVRR